MKKKPPGPVATARTLENVEKVREAVKRSPTHSAWRHAVKLGMSRSKLLGATTNVDSPKWSSFK